MSPEPTATERELIAFELAESIGAIKSAKGLRGADPQAIGQALRDGSTPSGLGKLFADGGAWAKPIDDTIGQFTYIHWALHRPPHESARTGQFDR